MNQTENGLALNAEAIGSWWTDVNFLLDLADVFGYTIEHEEENEELGINGCVRGCNLKFDQKRESISICNRFS